MIDEYFINNSEIEQVDQFTYLGTIVTKKLDFSANTVKTTKKARQRLYIISKLYHLGVNEKLITPAISLLSNPS